MEWEVEVEVTVLLIGLEVEFTIREDGDIEIKEVYRFSKCITFPVTLDDRV